MATRRRRNIIITIQISEDEESIEAIEWIEDSELGSLNTFEQSGPSGRPQEKLEIVIDSGASACALQAGWVVHVPTIRRRAGERTT